MSIRGRPNSGFTLLEVMIGVFIIAMLMVSVFRFTKAVLQAVTISTNVTIEKQEIRGLVSYLQTQLEELPARQEGALIGTPHKYNNLPADDLSWIAPAGHGILTTAGTDRYQVTFAIQNVKGKTGAYEIGLRRRRLEAREKDYSWLPLLPAHALEFRYFEPATRSWIEEWKDPANRPTLVRVRIWRTKEDAPYERVIAIPAAHLQAQ